MSDIEVLNFDKKEEGGFTSLFLFQCKFCGERWLSTFCLCPRCKRVRKFKILSQSELQEFLLESMFADRIHYALMGGK